MFFSSGSDSLPGILAVQGGSWHFKELLQFLAFWPIPVVQEQ